MKIAGVRFRTAGKIYYFDQGNLDLQVDNHVIVETQRGLEYGKVVFAGREMNPKDSKYPIKPIIRKSTISAEVIKFLKQVYFFHLDISKSSRDLRINFQYLLNFLLCCLCFLL